MPIPWLTRASTNPVTCAHLARVLIAHDWSLPQRKADLMLKQFNKARVSWL